MPLGASLQGSALAGWAAAAGSWWVEELRQMMPDRLPLVDRPRIGIILKPNGIVIERVHGQVGEKLEEPRPLEQLDEAAWEELRALIDNAEARIILTPPDVFVSNFELPAAARTKLRSAVALQVPLIAPVDPALLSWKLLVVSSNKDKVTVAVAMAKQSRLAAISQIFAERIGSIPAIATMVDGRAVELASAGQNGPTDLQRSNRRAALIAALLVASIPVTTLLGSWFLTSLAEERTTVLAQELEPRLQEERRAARSEQVKRALNIVLKNPSATETLEALALGLPEPVFAQEAQLDPGGIMQFRVETADAEKVDSGLAKTPLFEEAYQADVTPLDTGKMSILYRRDAR